MWLSNVINKWRRSVTELKIDSDIPYAPKRAGVPWKLGQLKIGDSIFFPMKRTSVSAMASTHGNKIGRKFKCQAATEKDPIVGLAVNGVRVWRVK